MSKLISLKNDKHINIVYKINNYNAPEKIYIPVSFLKDEVKLNDYVYKNTYFNNYISSISGYVSGIEKLNFNKRVEDNLVITNDYKENVKLKNSKIKLKSIEDLYEMLNKNNCDELIKKIKKIEKIDNLIISSIDEEEYSCKEFIRLSNNTKEILDTLDILTNILSLRKSLVVAKNTNFKSIKNVKSIIGTYPNIKINLVPDKYLINHKNFLCTFFNLSINNTLILTTNEIYNIYLMIKGKDINETLITISGNAVIKGIIINTRLGVSLKELLKEYISFNCDDYEIYINGYMQGFKLKKDRDIIINKSINYVVINKCEKKEIQECINCGACNRICPVNINVKKCYIKKLNHKKCIGCGLCNYICPANILLKEIVKSEKNEKEC